VGALSKIFLQFINKCSMDLYVAHFLCSRRPWFELENSLHLYQIRILWGPLPEQGALVWSLEQVAKNTALLFKDLGKEQHLIFVQQQQLRKPSSQNNSKQKCFYIWLFFLVQFNAKICNFFTVHYLFLLRQLYFMTRQFFPLPCAIVK
jgi:hypothetical protein